MIDVLQLFDLSGRTIEEQWITRGMKGGVGAVLGRCRGGRGGLPV